MTLFLERIETKFSVRKCEFNISLIHFVKKNYIKLVSHNIFYTNNRMNITNGIIKAHINEFIYMADPIIVEYLHLNPNCMPEVYSCFIIYMNNIITK